MTPKQKAEELIKRFKVTKLEGGGILSIYDYSAKQMALLCVDEILSTIEVDYDKPTIQANFWIWVKKELNNDSRK